MPDAPTREYCWRYDAPGGGYTLTWSGPRFTLTGGTHVESHGPVGAAVETLPELIGDLQRILDEVRKAK